MLNSIAAWPPELLSKADFEKTERPRSTSAARRTTNEKPKGRDSNKGNDGSRPPKQRKVPYHCNTCLNDGVCPFEKDCKQCKFPHLTKKQYDAELSKMKAAAPATATEAGQAK